MLQTNTNTAFITPDWPVNNILAFSTSKHHPDPRFLKNQSSEKNSHFGNFNLGLHVNDDQLIVKNNRDTLLKFLPQETNLQWLEQIHSADIHNINQVSNKPLIGDALITEQKGIALAVMTADCLPIIISDKDGNQIAAIHGGWRSLSAGIIKKTLLQMRYVPAELYAWLGPCIGPKAFEVGGEVQCIFSQRDISLEKAFQQTSSDKYHCDLQLLASLQLQTLGLTNISRLEHCTYSLDNYYSFRRNNITGRMATVICLL